jgi:hypothetical protein
MVHTTPATDINTVLSACIAIGLFTVFMAVKRRRNTLKDIRGPNSTSFWLGESYNGILLLVFRLHNLNSHIGNLGDIRYQKEVGDKEFPWMREYGGAWKLNGTFGVITF